MATFDPQEMIARFRDRAAAVRKRPLPPVAGEERQLFIAQAEADFRDFAIIGDAQATIEDGANNSKKEQDSPVLKSKDKRNPTDMKATLGKRKKRNNH
jgi:hypothetical protein